MVGCNAMAYDCFAVPSLLNEWRANPRIRGSATATDQRQRREIAVPSLSNGKSRKFYCIVTWIAIATKSRPFSICTE